MSHPSGRPVSANGAKLFKVAFDLEPELPDWPPVSVERLWGEKTEVNFEIRVVNTPLFVRGVSFGDLVRVRPDHERRELVFERFIAGSGHSTIRIIFLRGGDRDSVESRLRAVGCHLTTVHTFANLLSVDIPSSVNYMELRKWLVQKIESEDIELQESAISTRHSQR